MGAEVLKIEYPEGDRFRHAWMPIDVQRDGYEFMAVNANKKGLVLNLKKPEGVALFIELVKSSFRREEPIITFDPVRRKISLFKIVLDR